MHARWLDVRTGSAGLFPINLRILAIDADAVHPLVRALPGPSSGRIAAAAAAAAAQIQHEGLVLRHPRPVPAAAAEEERHLHAAAGGVPAVSVGGHGHGRRHGHHRVAVSRAGGRARSSRERERRGGPVLAQNDGILRGETASQVSCNFQTFPASGCCFCKWFGQAPASASIFHLQRSL